MSEPKKHELEEVVNYILLQRRSCFIGPFVSEEEAIRVMRIVVLPSVWDALDRSHLLAVGPRPPMSQPVVALRRREGADRATEVTMVPKLQLAHGTEVYTVEGLREMVPSPDVAMEREGTAEEGAAPRHPRIGEEYLVRTKEEGGPVMGPRKVLAFDREEGAGRTYVWYQSEKGRATCVMEILDWIPLRGKYAILAKAMHAAGLNKDQREVILAAFKELALIEGETHE